MSTSDFQLIAITNRTLAIEPLPERVNRLFRSGFDHVILREKDLDADNYSTLAREVFDALEPEMRPRLIFHRHRPSWAPPTQPLHVPLYEKELLTSFGREISALRGTSIHSEAELAKALSYGVNYVVAGHIFACDCKAGLAPRGLEFLRQIQRAAPPSTQVFALGGIRGDNIDAVRQTDVAGVCVMSSAMTGDPATLVHQLKTGHLR